MDEPTPRQVLYALVALGFHLVVGVLIVGAAIAGLVATPVSVGWAVAWAIGLIWGVMRWRRTVPVLLASMGLFVLWVVVTLIVS